MTVIKFARGLLAAIVLAPLALGNAAHAQQFSGRVVTMIVNYAAGGPADIDARLAARHLPKYLPDVGSMVVRNVGGAGGRIGVNQIGEASERDRLNVGFFTWNPVDQLIQEESLRVRYNDLRFIVGFRQPSLLYIRRDTPPGIRRPAAAVEEMRGAFEKLANDAEFIADYEKVVKTRPSFVIGAQGETIISELGKVQPSFLSFLRKYIDTER